ncbi:hypothetical protein [Skermanella pratensis]|uniref:hypothetical protein n=1 Tax=Skermanella pratensis TaxID=2233999 RepID=UPI001300EE01|nr:hypothetical protein [Skermanella pratensis]
MTPLPPEPAAALELVNIVLAPLPPFILEGMPPERPQGLVIDILSEAFRRDGRSTRYTYMPASRAEHTVRNGRAFATVIWGGFGRDARDFVLSDSLLEASVSAFVGAGYSGPPLDSFPAIAARQLDEPAEGPKAGRGLGQGRLRVITIHGDPVQDSLIAAGVEIEDVPSVASALTLVVRAQGRVVLVTFTDPAIPDQADRVPTRDRPQPGGRRRSRRALQRGAGLDARGWLDRHDPRPLRQFPAADRLRSRQPTPSDFSAFATNLAVAGFWLDKDTPRRVTCRGRPR